LTSSGIAWPEGVIEFFNRRLRDMIIVERVIVTIIIIFILALVIVGITRPEVVSKEPLIISYQGAVYRTEKIE
jgi:hypothetical protein